MIGKGKSKKLKLGHLRNFDFLKPGGFKTNGLQSTEKKQYSGNTLKLICNLFLYSILGIFTKVIGRLLK